MKKREIEKREMQKREMHQNKRKFTSELIIRFYGLLLLLYGRIGSRVIKWTPGTVSKDRSR